MTQGMGIGDIIYTDTTAALRVTAATRPAIPEPATSILMLLGPATLLRRRAHHFDIR